MDCDIDPGFVLLINYILVEIKIRPKQCFIKVVLDGTEKNLQWRICQEYSM